MASEHESLHDYYRAMNSEQENAPDGDADDCPYCGGDGYICQNCGHVDDCLCENGPTLVHCKEC